MTQNDARSESSARSREGAAAPSPMEDPEATPTPSRGQPSEVAMWHLRSGQPDNVTDEGLIVDSSRRQRAQIEKAQLRTEIARLREPGTPEEARDLARLAASYLLAGDAETARRYVDRARTLLPPA